MKKRKIIQQGLKKRCPILVGLAKLLQTLRICWNSFLCATVAFMPNWFWLKKPKQTTRRVVERHCLGGKERKGSICLKETAGNRWLHRQDMALLPEEIQLGWERAAPVCSCPRPETESCVPQDTAGLLGKVPAAAGGRFWLWFTHSWLSSGQMGWSRGENNLIRLMAGTGKPRVWLDAHT